MIEDCIGLRVKRTTHLPMAAVHTEGSYRVVSRSTWQLFLAGLVEAKGWTPSVKALMAAVEHLGEAHKGVWLRGATVANPITTLMRYTMVSEAQFTAMRRAPDAPIAGSGFQHGWSVIPPAPGDFKDTDEPTPREMEAYKRFLDSFKFVSEVPADKAHLLRLCDPGLKLFNLAKAKHLKNAP